MDAETRAYDFYAGAIDFVTDEKVVDLFEGLMQAEAEHRRLLADEMERLL